MVPRAEHTAGDRQLSVANQLPRSIVDSRYVVGVKSYHQAIIPLLFLGYHSNVRPFDLPCLKPKVWKSA